MIDSEPLIKEHYGDHSLEYAFWSLTDARVLKEKGENEEALERAKVCLQAYRSILGEGNKETLLCYGFVAELYLQFGNLQVYRNYATKYVETQFKGTELEVLLIMIAYKSKSDHTLQLLKKFNPGNDAFKGALIDYYGFTSEYGDYDRP